MLSKRHRASLMALTISAGFGIGTIAAEELPKFEELDKNDDGRLSLEEAKEDPDIAARFALADHDRNGYLTREEFNLRAQH